MKNRILTFIIGILVGAIITTAGFLIYSQSINNEQMMMPFNKDGQMQRPEWNMGEPPEKTQGDFRPTMQNNDV